MSGKRYLKRSTIVVGGVVLAVSPPQLQSSKHQSKSRCNAMAAANTYCVIKNEKAPEIRVLLQLHPKSRIIIQSIRRLSASNNVHSLCCCSENCRQVALEVSDQQHPE